MPFCRDSVIKLHFFKLLRRCIWCHLLFYTLLILQKDFDREIHRSFLDCLTRCYFIDLSYAIDISNFSVVRLRKQLFSTWITLRLQKYLQIINNQKNQKWRDIQSWILSICFSRTSSRKYVCYTSEGVFKFNINEFQRTFLKLLARFSGYSVSCFIMVSSKLSVLIEVFQLWECPFFVVFRFDGSIQ